MTKSTYSSTTKHPHSGGRTRRRGDELEAALLDAAWEELRAVGYREMAMESVADRAGTSRAVVHRRWPTKAEFVMAALRRHQPFLSGDVPDTGNLRDDVLAVLQRMSQRLSDTGTEIVYGLLGDYLANAELFHRLEGQLVSIGADVMSTILQRAVDRGEARPGVSVRIATLPPYLFRQELFLHRSAPSDDVLLEIVDDVFLPLVRSTE